MKPYNKIRSEESANGAQFEHVFSSSSRRGTDVGQEMPLVSLEMWSEYRGSARCC